MEYVEIGKVKGAHGLNGELKVVISEHFFDAVNEAEAFFVDLKGSKTPCFIDSIRGKGDFFLLKFEDIDTKEEAEQFTNKSMYLRREEVDLEDEDLHINGLKYGFLEGYEMHEAELGKVGEIKYVDAFPQQEMATVEYNGKDVFVPLVKEWIVKIDKAAKQVTVSLPEGLLSM